MEKFVTFCTGKKLDESTTSRKEGTETVVQKIKEKVTNIVGLLEEMTVH